MVWTKKKRRIRKSGVYRNYSVVDKLRKEKELSPKVEAVISSLSLEEIIAVKLELAARSTGQILSGLPLWNNLESIVRDAVLKYMISVASTQSEITKALGINFKKWTYLCKRYDILPYFDREKWGKHTKNILVEDYLNE